MDGQTNRQSAEYKLRELKNKMTMKFLNPIYHFVFALNGQITQLPPKELSLSSDKEQIMSLRKNLHFAHLHIQLDST